MRMFGGFPESKTGASSNPPLGSSDESIGVAGCGCGVASTAADVASTVSREASRGGSLAGLGVGRTGKSSLGTSRGPGTSSLETRTAASRRSSGGAGVASRPLFVTILGGTYGGAPGLTVGDALWRCNGDLSEPGPTIDVGVTCNTAPDEGATEEGDISSGNSLGVYECGTSSKAVTESPRATTSLTRSRSYSRASGLSVPCAASRNSMG